MTLNEKLAELCGWTYERAGFVNFGWMELRDADGKLHEPFTDSIDAQKSPGGPEELARAKGWRWQSVRQFGRGEWAATLVKGISPISKLAPTEAEARALALYEALKEQEDA